VDALVMIEVGHGGKGLRNISRRLTYALLQCGGTSKTRKAGRLCACACFGRPVMLL